jgi:hypothetical protein
VTTGPKTTRWGLSLADWDSAKAQAEAAVMRRARHRSTITYRELCAEIAVAPFKPYSWRLMALLDEVCAEADASHGVVLATLVVRADTGRPGAGYFRAFERLGADVSEPETFWRDQAERVWSQFAEK